MKSVLIAATGVLALSLGSAHAASTSAPLSVDVIPSGSTSCTSAPCPGSILPGGTSGWIVGFDDEFPGTSLNTNKWYVPPDGSSSFGDLQSCSTILSVNSGTMSMVHPGAPDNYGCDIHTYFQATFGYYEANVKTSNYPNGWGGFWILNTGVNNCAGNFEYGFEADIIETNVPASEQHLFWDGYGSCEQHRTVASGLPHEDTFHVYGLWVQPTGMTFYVDGVQTGYYAYNFPGGVFNDGVQEYMILSNTYISGTTDNGLYAHWVRFYHQ